MKIEATNVDGFTRCLVEMIRAAPADGMANLYIDADDLDDVVIDVRVNMREIARMILAALALSHGATDDEAITILARCR